MSLESLRREVRKLRDQIGVEFDIGPVVLIDPGRWPSDLRFAYFDATTEAERAAIYERAEGKPLITHHNTLKNGDPGVGSILIRFDPREYATE